MTLKVQCPELKSKENTWSMMVRKLWSAGTLHNNALYLDSTLYFAKRFHTYNFI